MARVQFQLLFSFFVIAIGVFPSAETCEKPDNYAEAKRSCFTAIPNGISNEYLQMLSAEMEMCFLTSLHHLSIDGFDGKIQDAFYRKHIHDERMRETVLTAIATCRNAAKDAHETIGKATEFFSCLRGQSGVILLLEQNLCK